MNVTSPAVRSRQNQGNKINKPIKYKLKVNSTNLTLYEYREVSYSLLYAESQTFTAETPWLNLQLLHLLLMFELYVLTMIFQKERILQHFKFILDSLS